MNPRLRLHASTAALALLMVAAPALAQTPPTDPETTARVDKLYNQATAEMDAHNYESACPKLESIIHMVPDAIGVRITLGECYESSGKLASAWSQYVAAEAMASGAQQAARVKKAAASAARLKPKLATLIIEVPSEQRALPGFALTLDGLVTTQAQWGTPLPVDKGAHTVVASASGHETVTMQADVDKDGVKKTVIVTSLSRALVIPPPVSASATPGMKETPPEPRGYALGFVMGGATLAAFVTGGVLVGLSASTGSAAEERREAIRQSTGRGDSACAVPPFPADCTKLKSTWADSDAVGNGSIVAFTIGGVALAATLTYFLWPSSKPKSKASTRVLPAVSRDAGGLWISGSF